MSGIGMISTVVKKLGGIDALSMQTEMVVMGNSKTGKSLENNIGCPLMKRNGKSFSAPSCPSCYAVAVLNNYPQVAMNVIGGNDTFEDVILGAAGAGKKKLSGPPVLPGERLRVYGISDFSPGNMKALIALSKVYKLDIISKTLWHFKSCRQYLPVLARLPGVCISLSFNKDEKLARLGGFSTIEESLEACRAFIRKHKLAKTVSLNYTFTTHYRTTGVSELEPMRRIPGVRVYHTTQHNKEKLVKEIGEDGVCGIFSPLGTRVDTSVKGNKGSCLGCNFCREGVKA